MRRPILQVYRDVAGGYRWRLVATNRKVLADSGEAYTRRRDAARAARTVIVSMTLAKEEQL